MTLSLGSNLLEDLPCGIGRLGKLRELYLGGKFFSLLASIKCEHPHAYPLRQPLFRDTL